MVLFAIFTVNSKNKPSWSKEIRQLLMKNTKD